MNLFKNKVFKNAGWLIGAKIVQSVLSLIVTIISARYLGPSNYGLVSYASSVVSFVAPIALLGLSNIEVQEIVDHPEDDGKILGSSIFMSVISAIVCMFGVLAFSAIADHSFETSLVVALYSVMLIFQATELIMYWFQAKYLNKFYALISLAAYVIVSAYKIFLLVKGLSIYLFAVSNAIDYFIISFLLYIVYKRKGNNKILFDKNVAKRLINKSKYYIIPNLMVAIFTQTDHIMLKHLVNEAATGYYQAAVTCSSYANFVFVAIIDSFRPKIFEDKKIDESKYENSMVLLNSIVIYLGLAIGLVMTIASSFIINLLYGQEYLESIPALMIVSWFPLFSYLGSTRNVWVLAENRQKHLWIVNLIGALSNVILNFILIPYFGMLGAAFASLVTQILTNIGFTALFKPYRRSAVLMLKGINPMNLIKLVKSR